MIELIGSMLLARAVATSPPRHAILVHKDQTCETAEENAINAPPQPTIHHAWVWTSRTGPKRVLSNDLSKSLVPDRDTLSITVVPRADCKQEPIEVIAAPVEMWWDVPESLLPHYPLSKSGRVILPRGENEPWRLRAVAMFSSSPWVDVEPRRVSVTLVASPASTVSFEATAVGGPLPPLARARLVSSARSNKPRQDLLAIFEPSAPRRYRIPVFPREDDYLLVLTGPSLAPLLVQATKGRVPDGVMMTQGATLQGSLVDDRDQPINSALVVGEFVLGPELRQPLPKLASLMPGGGWRLTGLPRGHVSVAFNAKGFAVERREIDAVAGTVDMGTIRLRRGIEVPVRVLDDAGAPVAEARVTVRTGLSGPTDAEGRFVLRGITGAAPFRIRVDGPGHLTADLTVSPPFPEEVRVTLPRAFIVKGRILGADDLPLDDAAVHIEIGNVSQSIVTSAGAFSAPLLPATPAILVVQSPTYDTTRIEVKAGAAGEVRDLRNVRLAEGLLVEGSVVAAEDGFPVAGARIWATRQSSGGPLVSWMLKDLLEASSEADGRFTLHGGRPGALALQVEAPGFARAHRDLTLKDGVPTDVGEVGLTRGATVNVRLRPARDDNATARLDLRGMRLDPDMLTAPVSQSLAVIEHVPAGTFRISVVEGSKQLCETMVEIEAEDNSVDATCTSKSTDVHGTVWYGKSTAGSGVLLWTESSESLVPDGIMTQELASGQLQQEVFSSRRPDVSVSVGPDGTFATRELGAGSWHVSFTPSSSGPTPSQLVQIPDSDTFETVLAFPGHSVSGVVQDDDGQPIGTARIAETESGGFAITDPSGRFAMPGLGTGIHHLQARVNDDYSDSVPVVVDENREPDPIKLVVSRGNSVLLHVQVMDRAGSPASGGFVFVDVPGRSVEIATADASGHTSVRIPKPFPDSVRFAAWASSGWAFGGWTPWKQARQGTVLVMGRSGTLIVQSEKAAGVAHVVAASGWDVVWLMARLGTNPFVGPDVTLPIAGLPEGNYTVGLGEVSMSVMVHDQAESVARLEGSSGE